MSIKEEGSLMGDTTILVTTITSLPLPTLSTNPQQWGPFESQFLCGLWGLKKSQVSYEPWKCTGNKKPISGLVWALKVHEPYIRHQIAEAYFLAA